MGFIWTIIRQYGWYVGIFVGILSVLMKWVISNYQKWIQLYKSNKDGDTVIEAEDLSNEKMLEFHPLFTNSHYRYLIEIPALDLIPDKPNREKVFKDLLIIAVKIVYEVASELIASENLKSWTSEEWVDIVSKAINKMVILAEERAKAANIPDLVIRKFLKWHAESVAQLHEYVLLLANSKLYNTNLSKMNTLLLMLHLLIVTILGDAERVIADINGEISGLNYNGLILE